MSKRKSIVASIAASCLLFSVCSFSGQVLDSPDKEMTEGNGIWTAEEMPVRIRYDRMWVYSDFAESTDSEMIGEIVDAIKELEVGAESQMATEDYTDLLTFTFEDGTTERFEFENQCWVLEDHTRYEVDGLPVLRTLLDEMLEAQTSNEEEAASEGDEAISEGDEAISEGEEAVSEEEESVNEEALTSNEEDQVMILKIAAIQVPVTWEENDSVLALKDLTKDGPLTIQMSMYGGFEQVGRIGQDIVSEDKQITTEAGDIVLYSSDQIVIFYGSNSWAYTRLGHVDLTKEEMTKLLGNGDVELILQKED